MLKRSQPEIITGAGAISVDGILPEQGGPGLILHDHSESSFWARVLSQPVAQTNAYAFARCDDYQSASFPVAHQQQDIGSQLANGPFRGNGVQIAAYEVNLRTDVPTDGSVVVRLFPLQGVPGYGFVYTPASAAIFTGGEALSGSAYQIDTDDTWETALTAALPGPGKYHVTVTVHGAGYLDEPLDADQFAGVAARLFSSVALPDAPGYAGAHVVALAAGEQSGIGSAHFDAYLTFFDTAVELRLQVQRWRRYTAVAVWSEASVGDAVTLTVPSVTIGTTAISWAKLS